MGLGLRRGCVMLMGRLITRVKKSWDDREFDVFFSGVGLRRVQSASTASILMVTISRDEKEKV